MQDDKEHFEALRINLQRRFQGVIKSAQLCLLSRSGNLEKEFKEMKLIASETIVLEKILLQKILIYKIAGLNVEQINKCAFTFRQFINEINLWLSSLNNKMRDINLQEKEHKAMLEDTKETIKSMKKLKDDILGWIPFWEVFQDIDSNPKLNREEKYEFLLNSVEHDSMPGRFVQSFTSEKYEEVMTRLRQRFGRRDHLIDRSTTEVLNLCLDRKKKIIEFDTFAREISTLLSNLFKIEPIGTLTVMKLYEWIIDCLPEVVKRDWKPTVSTTEDRLKELVIFLRKEKPLGPVGIVQNTPCEFLQFIRVNNCDGSEPNQKFLAKLNLSDLRGSSSSDEIIVRNLPWKFFVQKAKIHSNLNDDDGTIFFGTYVFFVGEKTDLAVDVHLIITLSSQKSDSNSMTKEYYIQIDLSGTHCKKKAISETEIAKSLQEDRIVSDPMFYRHDGWLLFGDGKFIKWYELIEPKNGFLVNNSVILSVEITVGTPKPVKSVFGKNC